MTPDVNVLIAASRSDNAHHRAAHGWLNEAIAACEVGASIKLMPMVAAGFLRLVTNPKIFVQPTPIGAAVDFLDALLEMPGVEIPDEGGEWPILRQLCVANKLVANNIPDAWLAASVLRHSEHLVTFDANFRKLLLPADVTVLKA